jgi:ribonuclease HI
VEHDDSRSESSCGVEGSFTRLHHRKLRKVFPPLLPVLIPIIKSGSRLSRQTNPHCKLDFMPYSRRPATKSLYTDEDSHRENPPQHHLIAHSDGGARGNPGPAGYGVVIQDQSGRKVARLSEYLGHQTNNFAEYQGLIAALEYALQHGPKALKLISDSELLVRQIKGIYKVKHPTLQDLHGRAKQLIAQLDWFSIGHALRDQNREADRLANEAMDKGMGRSRDPTGRVRR